MKHVVESAVHTLCIFLTKNIARALDIVNSLCGMESMELRENCWGGDIHGE